MTNIQEIVKASAGAGKTTELTAKYIYLLTKGVESEDILATTFTKKAAREIKERIIIRIIESFSDKADAKIMEMCGLNNLSFKEKEKLLEKVMLKQDKLLIYTLDAFYIQLATIFSAEYSFTPNWQLATEAEYELIFNQALYELCKMEDSSLINELLSLSEKKPYNSSVVNLLKEKLFNLHLIFRSSSRSAWDYYQFKKPSEAEINNLLEDLRKLEEVKTKANKPSSAYIKLKEKLIKYLELRDFENLLKETYISKVIHSEEKYNKVKIPDTWIDFTKTLIEISKAYFFNQEQQRLKAIFLMLNFIDAEVLKATNDKGVFNFDDVKSKLALNIQNSEISEVFYRLDSQIKHILLDEFQDTSLLDWQILKPFIDEVLAHENKERCFYCVGDLKQSIYGWRGASAEIFDSLESRYPKVSISQRTKTYRCSVNVIGFVNSLFLGLKKIATEESFPKTWLNQFESHTTNSKETGFIGIFNSEIIDSELEKLFLEDFDALKNLILTAKHVISVSLEDKNAEIAVLFRKNDDINKFKIILEKLAPTLEFSEEGANFLQNNRVCKLVIETLKFFDHPHDLQKEFLLSNSIISNFLSLNKDLKNKEKRLNFLRAFLSSNGLSEFIKLLCNYLISYVDTAQEEILNLIYRISLNFNQQNLNLVDFIRKLETFKLDSLGNSKVRLMTIHKSKGLEFDNVFIPDLASNLKGQKDTLYKKSDLAGEPYSKIFLSLNKDLKELDKDLCKLALYSEEKELEESLNLFYVALTRAKTNLFLYFSETKARNLTYKKIITDIFSLNTDNEVIYSEGDLSFLNKLNTENKNTSNSLVKDKVYPEIENIEDIDILNQKVIDIPNFNATKYGTIMHLFFEQVSSLENLKSDKEFKEYVISNYKGILSREYLEEVFLEFKEYLTKSQIRSLFPKESDNIEIFTEKSFFDLSSNDFSEYIIDRLNVFYDSENKIYKIEIIDYKTNVDSLNLESTILEKHKAQLKRYRKLVSEFYNLDEGNIELKLIYLDSLNILEL